MLKQLLLLTCLLFTLSGIAQVEFSSSNLPIMIINTLGQNIPDETKITAEMGLIYNGPAQRNSLDDPFNAYDGFIGIETRGSSSQSFPKKSYGIETRDAAGENNNVPLLGMPEENDWVLHGPFSDKSLIRNALAYKIGELLMDYSPRTRFVELVINNNYWGLYLLTEKIKRDKNRVAISKLNADENTGDELTGGYILKFDKATASPDNVELHFSSNYPPNVQGARKTEFLYHYPAPDDITNQQKAYIKSFVDEFEQVLKSTNFKDQEDGYRKYIDVSTFIRFLFVNEISKNVDGYRLSSYLYKDKDSEDTRLKMGPVWDFNLGFGNANYCEGGNRNGWAYDFNRFCPNDFWVIHFWWDRFLEDEAFIETLISDWKSLRTDVLSNERLLTCIDSMATELEEAQVRNFQRWPVLSEWIWPNNFIGNSYNAEITFLKDWLIDRLEWLDTAVDNLNAPTPASRFPPKVYPNPANREIVVEYFAGDTEVVTFQFYNSNGQLIQNWNNLDHSFGVNKFTWENNLASGIYFYRILIGERYDQTGKVIRH